MNAQPFRLCIIQIDINDSNEQTTMKFHLTTTEKQNLITGYGDDFIAVNQQQYHVNTIVMPDQLLSDWAECTLQTLNPTHFEIFRSLKPEVVLLGTGTQHQFLHPKLYQALTALNIPLECMTTAAACRTYNILMSEGRSVAAALFLK